MKQCKGVKNLGRHGDDYPVNSEQIEQKKTPRYIYMSCS